MTERLDRTATVTLDGSGTGALILGPSTYGETWIINRFTTQGNSTANPVLNIYRGAIGTALLDTTDEANSAVSDGFELQLKSGETLTAQYLNGTAGALMQFHLEGEISRGIS